MSDQIVVSGGVLKILRGVCEKRDIDVLRDMGGSLLSSIRRGRIEILVGRNILFSDGWMALTVEDP